ncbi:ribonuclease H-like domain-containing protein [Tanacetum coccineum]
MRMGKRWYSQQLGVDFDEIFILVVKPATIRTVLSLVVSRQWPIHKLDVKNAFFNDDLSNTVYMHQLPSFVDSWYPHHVSLLQRSLYGLKQAPRAWFQQFVVDTESKNWDWKVFLVQNPTLIRSLAVAHPHAAWLRNLLRELHSPLSIATLVYCDNISAVYMFANPVQHQRTKHIEINIHFVRDMVTDAKLESFMYHCSVQYAE